MSDDFTRPGLPASLLGGDPFAATPAPQPRKPVVAAREQAQATGRIPCHCACGCDNETDIPYSRDTNDEALRVAKCLACFQSHSTQPAGPAGQRGMLGTNVTSVRGTRTNKPVSYRQNITAETEKPDDLIAQRNEQIRRELDQKKHAVLIERWHSTLPERWRLPYDTNEVLESQVADRLSRLRGDKGTPTLGTGTSLICFGPFGSGKTWVAYTYARSVVEERIFAPNQVRVGTEASLLGRLASAAPWEMDKRFDELVENLHMLVLDDVGAVNVYRADNGMPTQRHDIWSRLVNWLYEHGRTLVLTTNCSLGEGEELEKWIGPLAYSRLRSMVGRDQVFRDEDKRTEMAARWEAEYVTGRTR